MQGEREMELDLTDTKKVSKDGTDYAPKDSPSHAEGTGLTSTTLETDAKITVISENSKLLEKTEVHFNRKGNLTAKTFYKTKKAVSPTCSALIEVRTLTSITDGASLSDDAKLPKFFEYPKSEGRMDSSGAGQASSG